MALQSGEIVVPLRAPRERLPLVVGVRSTLVLSSLQSLRRRALFDRYLAGLDPALHASLLQIVAGVWLPLELTLAHYRACDSLGLGVDEQAAIGADVGERVQGSVLEVTARAARGVGVTPWTALGNTPRLWDRLFEGGGGVEVRKLGPKDAAATLVGLPLLEVAYFRHAFRGAFIAGLQLFCTRAYVALADELRAPNSAVFRVSWA